MAPHSSTLAWKILWTGEPGRLQSMGLKRVEHDWATHFHFSLSCIGEGNGNPLQCSCLENPRDEGAWWAAVYGVAQSWTLLRRLSSSSSRAQLDGILSEPKWPGGKGNVQIQSAPASTWKERKKEKGCKLLISEMKEEISLQTLWTVKG